MRITKLTQHINNSMQAATKDICFKNKEKSLTMAC